LKKDVFEPLLDSPKNYYYLNHDELLTMCRSVHITGNPSKMKISQGSPLSAQAIKQPSTQTVLVKACSTETIQLNTAPKNENDTQEKIKEFSCCEESDPETRTPNKNFSPFYSYTYGILHCLCNLYLGYSMQFPISMQIPLVQNYWGLAGNDYNRVFGMLMTAFACGKIASAPLAGSTIDKFGRRGMLFFSEIFNIGSVFLMLSGNVQMFLWGRAFLGVYMGFTSTVSPRMCQEVYPYGTRVLIGKLFGFAVTAGMVISSSLSGIFGTPSQTEYWWLFVLVPAAISFSRTLLICLFWNHQTPHQILLDNYGSKFEEYEPAIDAVLRKYYPTEEGIAQAKVELEAFSQQKDEVQPKGICRFWADNLIGDKKIKRNVIAGIFFAISSIITGGAFILAFGVPIVIGIMGETAGTDLVYYSSYTMLTGAFLAIPVLTIVGRVALWNFGC
jgi:MFS family permease